MTLHSFDAVWWPYLFILLAGSFATDMWRFLGVYLAGHLSEDAPVLAFVRTIATALVAAVIAKLILYPEGALATTPVLLRIGAAVSGFAIYLFGGKRVYAGVLAAEIFLVGGMLVTGA